MSEQAGKGLRTIFYAYVLLTIAAGGGIVMGLVSRLMGRDGLSALAAVLLLLCMVAALVLQLIGLNTAVPAHEVYGYAWTVTIISIVVNIVGTLVGEHGLVGNLLIMVGDVLDATAVYFICTATIELLMGKVDEFLAERGLVIRRMYLAFTAVSLVCTLLSGVPLLNILAWVGGMIASVMLLVAGVLFVMFLYHASESLMA